MFTGIIEGIGIILANNFFRVQVRLRINALFSTRIKKGESIAVNGACLTVEDFGDDWFEAYASAETLRLTNLGKLTVNSRVNLERSLEVGDRLGGHFVSGHVDTLAKVQSIRPVGSSQIIRLGFPQEFSKFLINKGSIALDGISLTINQCGDDFLEVNIIPETQKKTIISDWKIGYEANMETDLIGKYLVKKTRFPASAGNDGKQLTIEGLEKYGYL
jgi:riboflavin synthase